MEPLSPSEPLAPLSKAAFHIDAESLRGQRLDLLLDHTLAAALPGGDGGPDPGGCSEFSCNLFSPPPPDQQATTGPTTTTEKDKAPPPKAPS